MIRTSLSFYILILILFEVASRAKLNLYKNTISSDVLRSTAEQIEMIDLSNQTHLPRTNPTQIISLHSVHELFMKYLYFQTRKVFRVVSLFFEFEGIYTFGQLSNVLSVSSWVLSLSRFWFFTWLFNCSQIYRASTLESLMKAEHGSLFWHCLYTVFCLFIDNNDLALIERFSTWWAVRYLVLAFIAFWTGLISVSY